MTPWQINLLALVGVFALAGYAAIAVLYYGAFRGAYPVQGRGLAMLAGLRWPLTVVRAMRSRE